ncbi:chalcone-flavanone isomerase-domain-containing protein [Xylariomycetidae sp. FL0641]|nr:chalcone-flavanone isomerase-domain-containing protein [Xylariomycetidae sp. FL0641]
MMGGRALSITAASVRSLSSPSARCIPRRLPQSRPTLPHRRNLTSARGSTRATESLDVQRMRHTALLKHKRRQVILFLGALTSFTAACMCAVKLYQAATKPAKLDAGSDNSNLPNNPFSTEAGSKRKTVVHDAEGRELVPTGNSTVPTFPRRLDVTVGAGQEQEAVNGVEYTLVGLGTRTVSFLGIQVYVVGYYVATADVAALQAALVKRVNAIATTLVPGEKDELRKTLLDPVQGEALWSALLRDVRPRSLFRVVPVRDTDFHHLRDGFVRAVAARSQAPGSGKEEFGDEAFAQAMSQFKALFNRGKVPKTREMLLCRDADGRLSILYDDGKSGGLASLGSVQDERLSRLLWLNWLAGAKVASEPARKNIVEGIMEFVERPVGTVATQVV